MNKNIEIERLRKNFPQKNDAQLQQWINTANKSDRLNKLVSSLLISSEQKECIKEHLNRVQSLLTVDRLYKISVVGATGAGKSALINALIGEALLASRDSTEAITGTIVTVKKIGSKEQGKTSKKAIIYCYSLEELTKIVVDYCKQLKLPEPIITSNIVDFNKTLQKFQSPSPVSVVTCCDSQYPFHSVEKCGKCGKQLDHLRDLLFAASQHENEKFLKEGQIELTLPEDIQRLRDIMDERSELNKKESGRKNSKRIIPLVERIEIEIITDKNEELIEIELTDLPGTQASTLRHEKRVQEQLHPDKTNAIILVLAKGERFQERGQALISQIKTVIMGDLQIEDKRLRAASRIFLVVNKGDIRYDRQALEDGIIKICEDISSNFLERHRDNVFDDIKARPALISQLMLTYPEDGQQWLNGNSELSNNLFKQFDREEAQKEYEEHVRRALGEFPDKSEDEAVLQWSNIPQLRNRLSDFLSNSRFEHDLKEALDRYQAAYLIAYENTVSKWKSIFDDDPSEKPEVELKFLIDNALFQYTKKVDNEVSEMTIYFKDSVDSLYGVEENILKKPLNEISDEIIAKISQETEKPEFRRKTVDMGIKTRFNRYRFGSRGNTEILKFLDEEVFVWLDNEVERVVNAMIYKFQKQPSYARILDFLDDISDHSVKAKEYINLYNERIINDLHQTYKNACRGAFFCQLRNYETPRKIIEKISNFANPVDSENFKEAQEEVIEAIRMIYQETFAELMRDLSFDLQDMFFYHLELSKDMLMDLIKDMKRALMIELSDCESTLYQYYHSRHAPEIKRATKLAEHLNQLKDLIP